MNRPSYAVILIALAAGAALGWFVKPSQTAKPESGQQETTKRKTRIAESKSRVKMVTTVVTNTVHDTVTNMVEVVRERQRGPEGWRAELERLKEENPAEYAARTNRMAQFRNQMLQRTANRLETLAAVDTTGWSKRQLETHERYQDLIARQNELMEIMRPDSGASDEQRREAMSEMRKLGGELHRTGQEERNTLLDRTIKALGYRGPDAAAVKEAITTIYSTTQDWGGPHHGRGPGRPPR